MELLEKEDLQIYQRYLKNLEKRCAHSLIMGLWGCICVI